MKTRIALSLLTWLVMAGFPIYVYAMSGIPYSPQCVTTQVGRSSYDRVQCELEGEPYVFPGAQIDSIPVSFIMPRTGNKLRLGIQLHGYTPDPILCDIDSEGADGWFLVKPCESYYPDQRTYAEPSGSMPSPWFGPMNGENSTGWVLGEAVDTASIKYGSRINFNEGITMYGTSLGGTGAILQSMLMPEYWRWWITVVDATLPHTLFVKNPGGYYWKDPTIQWAWQDFDVTKADPRIQASTGALDHIYYRIKGATNDNLGYIDLDFFTEVCDKWKIACFGTWDLGGHSAEGEPGVNLPRDLYAGENFEASLKSILPVFTEATSNHFGERGHYNLGLSINSVEGLSDKQEQLTVPVRYRRETGLGGDIPDQPESSTFNLTLRRIELNLAVGESITWTYGGQSGTAVVMENDEVTIEGLTLQSSDDYANLVLTPVNSDPKLVYTRQPRHTTPVEILGDASNWQHVTDVGRVYDQSEADVVLDNLHGNVEVIHDCTTTVEICAAQEAKVSPDGSSIVYSVATGSQTYPVKAFGGPLTDLEDFTATSAELWLYVVSTKTKTRLTAGHMDRMPEWCGNDCLVFASDRAGVYAPLGEAGNYYPFKSLQLYTAKLSGVSLTDIKNITPHEQFIMNPLVATNGDICYSSWQGFGDRGTGHSPRNMWWISCVDANGANGVVELGAHGSPYIKTTAYLNDWVDPARRGEGVTAFRALRPVAEIHKGYFAVSNYYRSNSGGANGMVFGWERIPVEGVSILNNFFERDGVDARLGSARYVPSTLRSLTPYGTDQDTDPRFHNDGRAAGRAGYASPWPGDGAEWLYTNARGWCYEAALPELANRDAMGGEPPCKKEIRLATVPVVTNPFDLSQSEVIACPEDEWQCWDARAVVPYQELYGQPVPEKPNSLAMGQSFLQVVDARAAELAPFPNATEQDKISFQGNADPDYSGRVTGFRIELVELWDTLPDRDGFKSRTHYKTALLEADGSVQVEVPCETPFLMSGVDAGGVVVAQDNMTHSLQCGETRTCHGCHDGHSEERAAEFTQSAAQRFKDTISGRK